MTITAAESATATAQDVALVPHWVDGTARSGSGSRRGDVYDPALGVVTKHVAFADRRPSTPR